MRNCPVCGAELPNSARFCSHCGEPQSATPIDGATTVSPQPDGQPEDVSIAATLPLVDNHEQEPSQASIPPGLPLSEKQRTPSSQYFDKEDKGGPRSRAMLLDIPETEAPLKSLSSPDYSSTPSPSIWPPRPLTAKWLIVGIIALVLIVGAVSAWATLLSPHSPGTGSIPITGTNPSSNTAETPTVSTTTTSPIPIISHGTVDLTFSGAVVGHITAARVLTCGSDQSVAGGRQYHVAVFGTVGSQQYALTFGVYPYTSPNTYTSSVFSFFGPAADNNSVAKWRSTPGLGANVTINSDGKSGTLDISYLSNFDNSAAHVSGSWKCA